MLYDVNWLGVLVAAGAACVLGFLWYSPIMFYTPWSKILKLDKLSKKEANKDMGLTMSVMVLQCLAQAYVMALVLRLLGFVDIATATFWAFLLWVGLGGGMLVSNGLFAKTRKKVLLIDSGYRLVALVVMAMVLVVVGY